MNASLEESCCLSPELGVSPEHLVVHLVEQGIYILAVDVAASSPGIVCCW